MVKKPQSILISFERSLSDGSAAMFLEQEGLEDFFIGIRVDEFPVFVKALVEAYEEFTGNTDALRFCRCCSD
jgi:hypothetical protein